MNPNHLNELGRWHQGLQTALGLNPPLMTGDSAFYAALAAGNVAGLVDHLCEGPETRVSGLAVLGRLLERDPNLAGHIAPLCDHPFWEPHEADRLTAALLLAASLAGRVRDHLDGAENAWQQFLQSAPTGLKGLTLLHEWNSADRLHQGLCIAAANRHRSYRVLFPTVWDRPPEHGQRNPVCCFRGDLVWAEITVCDSLPWLGGVSSQLVLAPWTFYLPGGEPEPGGGDVDYVHYEELSENLPNALAALRNDSEPPSRAVYLLALRPLRPEDLPWGANWAQRLAVVTDLTPRPRGTNGEQGERLEISGPSLGVAVALAAHAAARHWRVRPVVATGRIEANGNIREVGGIPAKVRAWAAFNSGQGAMPFVCPSANCQAAVTTAVETQLPPICLSSLAQIREAEQERNLFTDGFDGYWERVRGWLVGQPPEGALPEHLQQIDQTLQQLRPLLQGSHGGNPVPQSLEERVPLVCWFDANPREMADAVFVRLARDLEHLLAEHPERAYDLPMVLRVSAADLLGEGETLPPDRLARALANSCAGWPSGPPLPSSEDIAAALERPGKLILLIDDLPSLELWSAPITDRQRLARVLRELAQTQHVVPVFSDLHHQLYFEESAQATAPVGL